MSIGGFLKNFWRFSPVGYVASVGQGLFKGGKAVYNYLNNNGHLKSLLNSVTGAHLTGAQQEANAFEAQQAQNQMDFQERMSNTEYQRGVEDMKKAGLNPAMMYGSGANGASTPSGAMAASESPGSPDVVGLMTALSNLSLLKAQRDNIRSQTKEREQSIRESEQRIKESQSRVRMNEQVMEYYPSMQEGLLNKLSAEVADIYKGIDVKSSTIANLDALTALTETRNFVENLQADWIDRINEAKSKADKAAAAANFAKAAYDNYVVSFGKSHGGQLPGYNQYIGMAAALQDVIGKLIGEDDFDAADAIGKAARKAFKSHSGGR